MPSRRAATASVIPFNKLLTVAEMQSRADAFYWPYHTTIDQELARLKLSGPVPLLLSLHSFTPALTTEAAPRPMHVGVMASRDKRLADALLAAFARYPDLTAAFNAPYSGITHGYCLKMHGLAQGLPHAQIEVRQDLIGTAAGQARWADLLADILRPIVADAALHHVVHY